MRSFGALFFLLTLALAPVHAQDQTVRIDEIFKLWVKPGTPGASVAVIRDGKIDQ